MNTKSATNIFLFHREHYSICEVEVKHMDVKHEYLFRLHKLLRGRVELNTFVCTPSYAQSAVRVCYSHLALVDHVVRSCVHFETLPIALLLI